MERVLHNIASSYSDDGAVYSTANDHIDDLTRVLKLLKKGGAVLDLRKCIWCTDEGKFCGFEVVCGRGIKADTEKIEALASMKALPDKATLKSFLGSCVYLSRFVKDYATLTLPLYELEVELKTPLTSLRGTRNDGTPYWSEACERSFKGIKQALCTAPCLIFPDFQKPMIMITDCNAKQLGGILMQIDDSGVERHIAFVE